ncbi:transcription elongation factor SPT6-like [Liolophura sinensis]|uniref:transcription elongation factor SPT6-like n=1 Tax=Liolophura sinensis TaxID=3198878 RepID=UPI003158A217
MDFMEDEAEVSSGGDISDMDEDDEMNVKKSKKEKKKKKHRISDDDDDDDEEEEDDEELLREEMKDLINDDVEEEEEEEEEDNKRKHESDEEDDVMDDEDYDLIEENLGIKVQRKEKKRKRIKKIIASDDEDSDKEGGQHSPTDDRDVIANELFDDEEEAQERPQPKEDDETHDLDLEASEEESDVDDFIVDEEGQPISKKAKKKKHIIHSDSALQEAQDIFGVDFDFDEFATYGEEEGEEEEEDYEDEYIDEEAEGEGAVSRRKSKKSHKKQTKKSIFDVFEPSELERGHLTDVDNEIRIADMPERFQLRSTPVQPTEEGELEKEAEWIYKQAFMTMPTSRQNTFDQIDAHGAQYNYYKRKGPNTVNKIKDAINFMRNQQFEVPFIAFYRKEYVEPELTINDLWKVWYWDEKWTQLETRKKNMVRLFEKMQNYQFDQNSDPEKVLETNFRALTEDDIDRVKGIQTQEELRDVYQHFLLYYGADIANMHNAEKLKQRQTVEERGENSEQAPEQEIIKQPARKSGYTICAEAKLGDIAEKFGLKPEQFGENLRDNYTRHDIEQCPIEPLELAKDYVCSQFPTADDVLKGARHMVAMQIAHEPLVRQCLRETYYERAKLKVTPTKKGIKEIDENHGCYGMKYLKNKPVKDLKDDDFLKLSMAEDDHLLTLTLMIDGEDMGTQSYFEEIKQLYYRDEFSHLVEQWNEQRTQALERALKQILYPQMQKEIRARLLQEAKEGVVKACCRKLYNWLKVAPYQVDQQLDDDDDEDSSRGLRVMGLAFVQQRDTAAFCAMIDGDGEVTDYLRLEYMLTRRNAWGRELDIKGKKRDLEKLKEFIASKKPHVVAVTAESRDATMIMEDVKEVIAELEQEDQMSPISVELVDNEVAQVFQASNRAEADFREYPPVLRHAVSIARRLQDPLIEFAQLCNPDEDILCLRYHSLQDHVSKEELINGLYLEFVNRVNEVGVDVNRAIEHPHMAPLVQFICGLGPRKGSHMVKILKQGNTLLENRSQLVTTCHMGPKVFLNCAGFIKIDTNSLGNSTEVYVEVLDGSRVHPETYEWARKMAVDALEYDDTAEDANPAGALEEILESPERLKDLDLDAFAEELERQGYGNRHITLYDIRAELNHRYKDLRTPYRSPTNEEKFHMLTKETPQTFYIGKLVLGRVVGIAHKRPQGDQLDRADPVRDEDTGLWQCPFCRRNDLPELSDVWSHFDSGSCPGSAIGVRVRLDNGISGFLHVKKISDKHVANPEERVKVGQTLHCRITKIDTDRFSVDLTSRSSDLIDKELQWKPPRDDYYDADLEMSQIQHEEEKKKQQARQTYVKRVIAHPSFHNIAYKDCEKLMADMEQGDVIIRPSSKGSDHLTVTWKVTDNVLQHIDVKEEKKENAFSLGQSLWINKEEFEDLDEIIARHIQPMAAFARDILYFKYFKDSEGGKREILDKVLIDEKKKAPSRIPYVFSSCKQFPGKFLLGYLPRKKPHYEYVTVNPEGIRYRSQNFHSIGSLIRWFKEHFRDPVPMSGTPSRTPMMGRTPGARTPNPRTPMPGTGRTPGTSRTPMTSGRTPQVGGINLQTVDPATIQRAAAGLPSNIYNTLAQVAGATPQQFGNSSNFAGGYSGGYSYRPASTPMMTPLMTPSYHTSQNVQGTPAHQMAATPSYQPTPRSGWPGATPRTPAAQTPRQHPSQQTSTAGTDWAKAAAQWAKHRARKPATPRSGQSPRAHPSASPMDSPRGDATPLIDER